MPVLVQSILSALPRVANVLMLCGFIFLVFAIVGLEVFKGESHYRCALPGFVETAGHPVEGMLETRRVLKGGGGPAGGGGVQGKWDTGRACNPDLGSMQCDDAVGQRCMYFDLNPMHDLSSFDHVGTAFIVLLQARCPPLVCAPRCVNARVEYRSHGIPPRPWFSQELTFDDWTV